MQKLIKSLIQNPAGKTSKRKKADVSPVVSKACVISSGSPSGLISHCFFLPSALSTPASPLFFRHTIGVATTGPLHLKFPLLGMLFLNLASLIPYAWISKVTFSMRSSLALYLKFQKPPLQSIMNILLLHFIFLA